MDKRKKNAPADPAVEEAIKAANDPDLTESRRDLLCDRFPVVSSSRDAHADFKSIRRRMKIAARLGNNWRGSMGFIEVSLQDMVRHGAVIYGRNYVLPELSLGVHEVASPVCGGKDGTTLTEKQMRENKKKCSGLVGCNANGSGTAKAMMACRCLELGIRCILNVGQCTIVDNWPDRDEVSRIFNEFRCAYSVS